MIAVVRWVAMGCERPDLPWRFGLAALALLLLLVIPVRSLVLGLPDDSSAPEGSTQRDAFDIYCRHLYVRDSHSVMADHGFRVVIHDQLHGVADSQRLVGTHDLLEAVLRLDRSHVQVDLRVHRHSSGYCPHGQVNQIRGGRLAAAAPAAPPARSRPDLARASSGSTLVPSGRRTC